MRDATCDMCYAPRATRNERCADARYWGAAMGNAWVCDSRCAIRLCTMCYFDDICRRTHCADARHMTRCCAMLNALTRKA
jgi:hypothetical protein